MRAWWLSSLIWVSGSLALLVGAPLAQAQGEPGVAGAKEKSSAQSASPGSGRKREAKPSPVRVITATYRMVPRWVRTVAPLYGQKQVDIYARVTGQVSEFALREGDPVKAGQVLFKLERSDAGDTFLKVPVTSPISGWVGRWLITNIGGQVTTATPVVTVVDDSSLRATVFLSTAEWVGIDDKAGVSVSVGGEKMLGKIASIARTAEASSGRGSVIVEVNNQDQRWRAGMLATVEVSYAPKSRLVLPAAVLNITDQGVFVFAVKDNLAKRIAVEYQLIDNDTVEILRGVEDGAVLVVAGSNLLFDNAPVSVVGGENEGAS